MNQHRKLQIGLVLESLLPFITLLFLMLYTVLFFVAQPYLGFYAGRSVVMVTFGTAPDSGSFQIGDKLLQVGNITQADVDADLRVGYFNGLKPGDTVDVTLERQGEKRNFQYTLPGVTAGEVFDRLNSNWFLPYIFWIGGAAVLLFLRPRSQVRTLLALFCFITSVWLSAGLLSDKHQFGAALLLRSTVWLSVPIYLYLHWLFPTPLKRLPEWLWAVIFGLGVVMAIASWWQWVPEGLYMAGFLLALFGSMLLLITHAITQPTERRALLGLIAALGIVLLPVVGVLALELFKVNLPSAGLTTLGLAALPGFYFFTLYRRQFSGSPVRRIEKLIQIYVIAILAGFIFCIILAILFSSGGVSVHNISMSLVAAIVLIIIAIVSFAPFLALPALANEQVSYHLGGGRLNFSANRVAAGLFFILLESILVLLLTLLAQAAGIAMISALGLALVAVVSILGALAGYPPFRRWFERLALGMKLVPETLAATYSERITTSLDINSLRRLLLDEVLPSLLVRQFAQVKIENGAPQAIISLRVAPEDLPASDSLAGLEAAAGKMLPVDGEPGLPAWVRLVLPLRVANETRGYWLLGQRDPDNQYSEADVELLKTLAGQTALAVVNIEQAENLQAFYFADIGRNEAERSSLAAELHDDVLNQLAVINNNLPEGNSASQEAYDKAVARIRDIINGLRPTMLNFGLHRALETLTDDLNDRLPEGPKIVLGLPASDVRYEQDVELSLFRIVQQACNNAIQHADCQHIEISGSLDLDEVHLTVLDDGKGFEMDGQMDLAKLLAGKHFGLVGMFERAALIGAELRIDSVPGQGSQIVLTWLKK